MTNRTAFPLTGDLVRSSSLGGLLVAWVALGCTPAPGVQEGLAPTSGWNEMVAAEEAILEVAPAIKRLNHSVLNLEIPDEGTRRIFGDRVDVRDLGSVDLAIAEPLGTGRFATIDDTGREDPVSRADLALWRPLLDRVEYFEHAKFYVVRGSLASDPAGHLETDLGFEALARVPEGRTWLRGKLKVTWAGVPPVQEDGSTKWSIVSWRTEELHAVSVDRPLFAEVLDEVLRPEALQRARRSIHEELVLEYLLDPDGFEKPTPFFSIPAADRHPGIAVTDLDRDGFDDIYVMARWGPNQFFRNQGDGTFEEIAGELGLDLEGHTSSALFADFDNDGDSDVFIGGTLLPSVYLVNERGRFVDRSTELVDGPLPALVSSVSAADYDNDGLLDLYVATYAADPDAIPSQLHFTFLPAEDALELSQLRISGEDHVITNLFGPPNVLLKNQGAGRFTRVEYTPLKLFKNSYQATWADYDNDGDMDVYVANDFAPNNLFRNDGADGFTDVTPETGTGDTGFGMGVSWGDFDRDGLLDLYVTNMYSKAGLRITEQLDVDPTFGRMAHGNTLFRNNGTGLDQVSSLERPGLLVAEAGWGWGSQFIDVDNDSDLDIYALSGHYTAPSAVELPIDI